MCVDCYDGLGDFGCFGSVVRSNMWSSPRLCCRSQGMDGLGVA